MDHDKTVESNLTINRPQTRIVLSERSMGIFAALSSALFLGMTPIFGKRAIIFGMPPLAVVAIRTILAALLLLVIIAIFRRQYLFIYPAGMLGCVLAGWINGLGSLFYYSALGRIGAGVGTLLYSLYPVFVALWLVLDHQRPSKLTLVRMGLAIPAIFLLTQANHENVDLVGVAFMLIASALYALHLPINQRVLFDMPAPTVTLYTLISMSAIVVPTYLFSGIGTMPSDSQAWWPVFGLTLVTFFSRLTLFLGVKHIGGMQTALLGLSELLLSMLMAQTWLGEHLSLQQWAGAFLLGISLVLVGLDKATPKRATPGGWLSWLSHPSLPREFPWQPHD
jgi:drug/metabolite transporter (DMT)-like permease